MMFNPDTAPGGGAFFLNPFEAAARSLAVEPITVPVRSDAEIEAGITSLGRERAGLVLQSDSFLAVHPLGLTIPEVIPAARRRGDRMRRREIIPLMGGAMVPWPLAAQANQPGKVWRIGYLSGRSGRSDTSHGFVQGLRELGYVEGENLIVEYRFAMEKNERLPELAADLVRARVDLIATEGTPSTKAAMQATSTIPIVFGSAQDPVEKGIVASLARPGGNVTGTALIADQSKALELLKGVLSGASHVAFIYDPATRPGAYGEAKLKETQDQARTLDMMVQPIALRDPEETDRVFAALPAGTNALLLENSVINLLAEERICALASAARATGCRHHPRVR